MKKLLFTSIAAMLFFAACKPTEVESAKPEETKTETPAKPAPSVTNDFNNNKYWLILKTGKYELYNRDSKTTGQFGLDEAERLLRMPGTVWQIPTDAPYVFDQVAGLKFDKRLIK